MTYYTPERNVEIRKQTAKRKKKSLASEWQGVAIIVGNLRYKDWVGNEHKACELILFNSLMCTDYIAKDDWGCTDADVTLNFVDDAGENWRIHSDALSMNATHTSPYGYKQNLNVKITQTENNPRPTKIEIFGGGEMPVFNFRDNMWYHGDIAMGKKVVITRKAK